MYTGAMSYEVLKKGFVFILILYFMTGVFAEVTGSGELYPVFSWRLFARIPSQVSTHAIEIHELGDTIYSPPIKFSNTKSLFEKLGQSPTDYEKPVRELVQAIRTKNEDEVLKRREIIENIFPWPKYKYSVVEVQYDSIEYWQTGTYEVKEVLATYENK